MIKTLFALLYFLLNVLAFSQDFDNMKMGIGSATSTLTDFYCEVEIGEFSVEISIDRLKGNLRNYNLEVELEDYYNEYFQFLIGVMSASANGISIQFHDKSDYFSLEIGKLSYALNDWDLMFTEDGPRGTPTLNVSFDLQNTTIVLPSGMTGNRRQQEWEIYNYLTNERDITIQKISLDVIPPTLFNWTRMVFSGPTPANAFIRIGASLCTSGEEKTRSSLSPIKVPLYLSKTRWLVISACEILMG